MKYNLSHYNQFCDALDITFTCPNCGRKIKQRVNDLPVPDFFGEDDGINDGDAEFYCPGCGKQFFVDMFVDENKGLICLSAKEDSVFYDDEPMYRDVKIEKLEEINFDTDECF